MFAFYFGYNVNVKIYFDSFIALVFNASFVLRIYEFLADTKYVCANIFFFSFLIFDNILFLECLW